MAEKSKPAPVYQVQAQEQVRRASEELSQLLSQRHAIEIQRDDLNSQLATIDRRLLKLRGMIEGVELGQRFEKEIAANEAMRREHGVE